MNLISLELIQPNPYQRRTEYGDIAELAGQIAAAFEQYPASRGVMQLPRGRQLADGSVQLLYGHRRIEALRYLHVNNPRYADGLAPVQLTEATDEQMLDAVWAENAQRRQLSAVEEARLMADALDALSNGSRYTQSALAKRWGIAQPTVANRLRLLQLPAEVQAANTAGIISERVALALIPVQKFFEAGFSGVAEFMADALVGNQTSEEIRERVELWTKQAEIVDKAFLTQDFSLPGIEQTACFGCKFLLNGERCIKPTCLQVKKLEQLEQAARDMSGLVGGEFIPFADLSGDDIDHLRRMGADYEARARLVRLLNTAPPISAVGRPRPWPCEVVLTVVHPKTDGVAHKLHATPKANGKWVEDYVYTERILAFARGDVPEPEQKTDKAKPAPTNPNPLATRLNYYTDQIEEYPRWEIMELLNVSLYPILEKIPTRPAWFLCEYFNIPTSDDVELNLIRLTDSLFNRMGKIMPALALHQMGLEPHEIGRDEAHGTAVDLLAEFIKTHPYGSKLTPYGEQTTRLHLSLLTNTLTIAQHHRLHPAIIADLQTAIDQCEAVIQ